MNNLNQEEREKFEINLITQSYFAHKRKIREDEESIIIRPIDEIKASRRIIGHIDAVIDDLNEKDKFIIENEVKNGKEGKWYMIFLSSSTYYRQRKKAYKTFLRCLEK